MIAKRMPHFPTGRFRKRLETTSSPPNATKTVEKKLAPTAISMIMLVMLRVWILASLISFTLRRP